MDLMPGTATNRDMIIECYEALKSVKSEVRAIRTDLREIKAELSKHAIIEEKLKKGENTDKTTGWFMFF